MQLQNIYDKLYLLEVCKLLNLSQEKGKNMFYDPATDSVVELDKKELFLNCWRHYFKVLMPYFINKNTTKIQKKKAIETIHLIFGNEVSQITRILYSNALFFRVGVTTLYGNAEKYKHYGKQ